MSTRVSVQGKIILVDDEVSILGMIRQLLETIGYEVVAFQDADRALAHVEANVGWADILVTDHQMPGLGGLELLRRVRAIDGTLVGIVITGYSTTTHAVEALRAGAFDFVSKPIDLGTLEVALDRSMQHRRALVEKQRYQERTAELLTERGEKLAETTRHLEDSYQFMLESMVALLEAREPLTGEHTKRVTHMSVCLAQAMGIEGEELESIRRAACLHDVGKIAVPDAILLKNGPLDPHEWTAMKRHVDIGYNILRSSRYMQSVAEIVYSHHENFDGSGYPRGLKGEEICRGARIFRVVDAYDAIRSTRTYSTTQSAEAVLQEIQRCSGTHFDPEVVTALAQEQEAIERVWWEGATASDREATSGKVVSS